MKGGANGTIRFQGRAQENRASQGTASKAAQGEQVVPPMYRLLTEVALKLSRGVITRGTSSLSPLICKINGEPRGNRTSDGRKAVFSFGKNGANPYHKIIKKLERSVFYHVQIAKEGVSPALLRTTSKGLGGFTGGGARVLRLSRRASKTRARSRTVNLEARIAIL